MLCMQKYFIYIYFNLFVFGKKYSSITTWFREPVNTRGVKLEYFFVDLNLFL